MGLEGLGQSHRVPVVGLLQQLVQLFALSAERGEVQDALWLGVRGLPVDRHKDGLAVGTVLPRVLPLWAATGRERRDERDLTLQLLLTPDHLGQRHRPVAPGDGRYCVSAGDGRLEPDQLIDLRFTLRVDGREVEVARSSLDPYGATRGALGQIGDLALQLLADTQRFRNRDGTHRDLRDRTFWRHCHAPPFRSRPCRDGEGGEDASECVYCVLRSKCGSDCSDTREW